MAAIIIFANDTERQIQSIHITARVTEKNGYYNSIKRLDKIQEIQNKLESVLLEYFDSIDDESDYYTDKQFDDL